jgi:hypothetical protein
MSLRHGCPKANIVLGPIYAACWPDAASLEIVSIVCLHHKLFRLRLGPGIVREIGAMRPNVFILLCMNPFGVLRHGGIQKLTGLTEIEAEEVAMKTLAPAFFAASSTFLVPSIFTTDTRGKNTLARSPGRMEAVVWKTVKGRDETLVGER